MFEDKWGINFPLTIERQLKRFYLSENHTERHEVLWHTWNQNRRWITQLLEITLCSYPTYSKHDESHAQTVLHNIEMILGEDRIAELSASDCFVLLHTVYIHDIGMCITHQDREEILKNRKFIDMISELEGYEESSLHHAIMALQKTEYRYDDEDDRVKRAEKLYMEKLDVYYALIQLIGDFRRGEHGEKSKERLYNWVKEPDRLGSGFSLAGMPQRIFLTIANCARMHTQPEFDAIMQLPQEDDGYASDYIHPRFVSVLLQIGDLLDMDNNRFHPLMELCMGKVPEASQQHFEKHMSIRKLHIRPDKIEIEADCETQEALRLIRRECDMLKSILKEAGYSWSVICPPGYKGALPTVESVNLYMRGKRIPEELVTTQFQISQQKAFTILEGANVYPAPFVFIREFLQNALDATKLQYWNDCISTSMYYKNMGIEKKDSPYDLEKYVTTENYPIEINLEIQKKTPEGKICPITAQDIEDMDSGKASYNVYGVKVSVKDFGTGIDKGSILNISKVGSSRKKDRAMIETMPEWLRPTAEFGIGLQSAFLLVGSFRCYTRTRNGERYHITFGSGSSLRYGGYINVEPAEKWKSLQDDTYGTCFEVFVPSSKKNLHKDCLKAWNGEDPFSEDYERRRPLRHAAELITQIAIYISDIVGELIFPLHVNITKCEEVEISLKNEITNVQINWIENSKNKKGVKAETKEENTDENVREWIKNKKSWIFYKDTIKKDSTVIYERVDNDIYLLDCKSSKLHIWSSDMNTFLTISAKNLWQYEKGEDGCVEIYYKGIKLQTKPSMDKNIFIEYIDIKGDLARELLNLSRKGFTDKGNQYFEEVIYPGLQNSIQRVLKSLEKDEEKRINQIGEELQKEFESLKEKMQKNELSEKNLEKFCQHILSAVVLIYIANCNELNFMTVYGKEDEITPIIFDDLMQKLVSICNEIDYNGNKVDKVSCNVLDSLKRYSTFFKIRTYRENLASSAAEDDISLVDFFDSRRHFAIVQKRESTESSWTSYLIYVRKQEIYKFFEELIFTRNKKKKDCEQVEKWIQDIIKHVIGKENDNDDYKQQFLLNWLLRNVPTIAMMSDRTGNVRINILSMKIFPYIYMNDNFKFLILERMLVNYKKHATERFSTIAWQNQEYLICKDIPFSAFFVKRGKLSQKSFGKVIVPFSGENLWKMQETTNNVLQSMLVQNIYVTLNALNMQEYLQFLVMGDERIIKELQGIQELNETIQGIKKEMKLKNVILDIYVSFFDTVDIGKNALDWEKASFEEVADLVKCSKERLMAWHKIYMTFAKVYLRKNATEKKKLFGDMIRHLNVENEYKELCVILNLFVSGHWREFVDKFTKSNLEEIGYKDGNRMQIIEFISSHAKYPISKENIEICYSNFENEIVSLFQKKVQAEIEPEVQRAISIWNRETRF